MALASIEAGPSTLEFKKPRVAISYWDGEYHVIALALFEAGAAIMTIEGDLSTRPCRYSVQVDRHLHIAPPAPASRTSEHDRWLWRFLNHSCQPNAKMNQRLLIAVTPISPGDEITFDYNANEYEMAAPFRCRCGHCGGSHVRGFRFLNPTERQLRSHLLADYLRPLLDHIHA